MADTFKPNGYNSVSPYFVVDGAQKLVDLLRDIFEADEIRRFDRPDGKIMHLELQIDDSVIMIADATDQYPPNNNMLHVYVQDVDAVYNKAIDLGCTSMGAPTQAQGDSDKRGTFTDFAGNIWSIGTQVQS